MIQPAEDWRFFATRLNGDGTEDLIAEDLALHDPSIEWVLSGSPTLAGKIQPEDLGLQDEGEPILVPWSTAIYAELNERIIAGGIVQPTPRAQGPTLTIDAAGFSHYPHDMPYDGERYFVETDALDIYRHIWDHLQSQPGGNLGLQLDAVKAGVLVGEELEEVTFVTGEGETVFFEAGPFKLAWWLTDDLASRLADLSELAKFEWVEQHSWGDGKINHRIRFGVPRLGRRRQDMHFKAGDNLIREPEFEMTPYASEVWALGGGEGRAMPIGRDSRSGEKRLRRVSVIIDKQARSRKRVRELAAAELPRMEGKPIPTSMVVARGADGLPDPGDEVLVSLEREGWHGHRDIWVRVMSMIFDPSTPFVTCQVVRAE